MIDENNEWYCFNNNNEFESGLGIHYLKEYVTCFEESMICEDIERIEGRRGSGRRAEIKGKKVRYIYKSGENIRSYEMMEQREYSRESEENEHIYNYVNGLPDQDLA